MTVKEEAAATADPRVTLTLRLLIMAQVWPVIEHEAEPVWMFSYVGNIILIKLEDCNLFVIVNVIVYVVIAFTWLLVAVADPDVIAPTIVALLIDLVYIAYAIPLFTTYVVALNVKLRVDGGLITVNPDIEKTVTPDNVICVEFWENTVIDPE